MAQGQLVDTLVLARLMMGHWRSGLVVFAAGVAVVLALAAHFPGYYRSEALLRIHEGAQMALADGDRSLGAAHLGPGLHEYLLTRGRLERIRSDLKLRSGSADPILELRERTRITVHQDSVAVSFEAPRPDEARAVLVRLTDELMDFVHARLDAQVASVREFLAQQTGQAELDLGERELRLSRFVHEHFVGLGGGGRDYFELAAGVLPTSAGALALGPPNAAAVRAPKAKRHRRRHRGVATPVGSPAPQGRGAEPPAPVEGTARALAQQETVEASRALAREQATKTPLHPDVEVARRRLERALAALAEVGPSLAPETGAHLASPANPPPAPKASTARAQQPPARRRVRVSSRGPAAATSSMGKRARGPARGGSRVQLATEWARLKRERDQSAARYAELAKRLFRANVVGSAPTDRISVLDAASLPTRSSSHRAEPIAAGLLVALALGIGWTYLAVLLFGAPGSRFVLVLVPAPPVGLEHVEIVAASGPAGGSELPLVPGRPSWILPAPLAASPVRAAPEQTRPPGSDDGAGPSRCGTRPDLRGADRRRRRGARRRTDAQAARMALISRLRPRRPRSIRPRV